MLQCLLLSCFLFYDNGDIDLIGATCTLSKTSTTIYQWLNKPVNTMRPAVWKMKNAYCKTSNRSSQLGCLIVKQLTLTPASVGDPAYITILPICHSWIVVVYRPVPTMSHTVTVKVVLNAYSLYNWSGLYRKSSIRSQVCTVMIWYQFTMTLLWQVGNGAI